MAKWSPEETMMPEAPADQKTTDERPLTHRADYTIIIFSCHCLSHLLLLTPWRHAPSDGHNFFVSFCRYCLNTFMFSAVTINVLATFPVTWKQCFVCVCVFIPSQSIDPSYVPFACYANVEELVGLRTCQPDIFYYWLNPKTIDHKTFYSWFCRQNLNVQSTCLK